MNVNVLGGTFNNSMYADEMYNQYSKRASRSATQALSSQELSYWLQDKGSGGSQEMTTYTSKGVRQVIKPYMPPNYNGQI